MRKTVGKLKLPGRSSTAKRADSAPHLRFAIIGTGTSDTGVLFVIALLHHGTSVATTGSGVIAKPTVNVCIAHERNLVAAETNSTTARSHGALPAAIADDDGRRVRRASRVAGVVPNDIVVRGDHGRVRGRRLRPRNLPVRRKKRRISSRSPSQLGCTRGRRREKLRRIECRRW
jgi:hypothetical protein